MSRLVKLYDEIAALTRTICASCPVPFSCCAGAAPLGCSHTKWWARTAWNTELVEQQAGELPFMTPSGCSVSPHMRPVCSLAVCRPNALPPRYFELVQQIAKAEQQRWQSPEGQARAARLPSELRTNPEAIITHVCGKPKG